MNNQKEYLMSPRNNSMLKIVFFLLFFKYFLSAPILFAQEYVQPLAAIDPEIMDNYKYIYKNAATGSSFNPVVGTEAFSVTDISIPGNFDLPVELTRWVPSDDTYVGGPVGWSWNIPFVKAHYMANVQGNGTFRTTNTGWRAGRNCTGTADTSQFDDVPGTNRESVLLSINTYWDGILLNIPGKTSENFLISSDGSRVTKSNYKVANCTTATNGEEGMEVRGPDGTLYEFNNVFVYDVDENSYDVDQISRDSGWWRPARKFAKFLRATKVTDRFGNWVAYHYNTTNQLDYILASDGRRIDIGYENYNDETNLLKSRPAYATANGKTWQFKYWEVINTPGDEDNWNVQLKSVILPDNTSWQYDRFFHRAGFTTSVLKKLQGSSTYNVQGIPLYVISQCGPNSLINKSFNTTVTNPNGLAIQYEFKSTYHGRSGVEPEYYSRTLLTPHNGGIGGSSTTLFPKNESCIVKYSLQRKTITGPGLSPQLWVYSYSGNRGSWTVADLDNPLQSAMGSPDLPSPSWGLPSVVTSNQAKNFRSTTVTGPDSKTVYYIDRKYQSSTEGMVIATDYLSTSNQLLKREELTYEKGEWVGQNWFITEQCWDQTCPTANSLNINQTQYQINKSIETTYMVPTLGLAYWDIYTKKYKNYNKYGVNEILEEYNDQSAVGVPALVKASRTDYINDVSRWVLSVPWRSQISADGTNWTTVSAINYHSNIAGNGLSNTGLYVGWYLPYENLKYGTWFARFPEYFTVQNTLGSPGNLKRLELNQPLLTSNGTPSSLNRYQTFQYYKRGKPASIYVSARYNSSGTLLMSRNINDDGLTTSITDLNGVNVKYGYDSVGRLTYVDYPGSWLDLFIKWSVNSDGKIQRVASRCTLNTAKDNCADAAPKISTARFDAMYRILDTQDTDVTNSINRYKNFTYDSRHLVTFESFAASTAGESQGKNNVYDGLGRLSSTSVYGGGTTVINYLTRNSKRVTDPLNNITTTKYLAYGTPQQETFLQIQSPEGITTTQDQNIFGDLLSINQSGPGKNGVGNVSQTEYRAYNGLHQLCKVVRNDVGISVFSNNVIGQVIAQADGVSQGTSGSNTNCLSNVSTYDQVLTYDSLGDLYKVDYSDSSPDITLVRDNNGKVLSQIAGGVTQTYTYTDLGAIDTETFAIAGVTRAIDWDYDSLGNIKSLTYPDGDKIQYSPNAFGEPRSVSRDSRTGRAAYTYANNVKYYPDGQIDTFNYGNGLTHKTTLNTQKLPQNIRDYGATTALDYTYTYDNNQNVKSITDAANTAYSIPNIQYDGLDRLVSVTGNNGIGNSSNKYDGLGNITYYSSKNSTLDYNYDGNNRLSSISGTGSKAKNYSFLYTSSGEVSYNGSRSFNWNFAGQMQSSGSNSYIYDGYNRRVKQTDSAGTSYSFYTQAGQLVYRLTAKGDENYIYLGKRLIAKDGVIDDNNAKQHFKPYGGSVEGAPNDVNYTGHKFDKDLNLIYAQARYYDPDIGRFYSNDPIGYRDIHSFNRYTYTSNNPYRYTDPTGMMSFADAGKVFGKRAITAGITSQMDSPVPGPADVIAIGILVVSVGEFTVNVLSESAENEGTRSLGELETIHDPDHPQNDPEIGNLSDEELGEAINNPENGDRVKVRGNKVLDGNTRVNEAKSRGWSPDTPIPVDEFPELPDNIDEDPLGPYR